MKYPGANRTIHKDNCIQIIRPDDKYMTKKEIIPSTTFNHLDVGHPDNKQPYRICGAPTRNEMTVNEYCQQPAGWGTWHVGEGRCKLHGGGSVMKVGSTLWKKRLGEILQRMRAEPEVDPVNLVNEITIMRVLLNYSLEKLQGIQPGPHDDDSPAMATVRNRILNPSGTMHKKIKTSQETGVEGPGGIYSEKVVPVDDPLTEFLTPENPELEHEIEPSSDPALWMQVTETLRDITNTAHKMNNMRNASALTAAEVTYLLMMMKEGMDRFVPAENREPFIRYLMEKIPYGKSRSDDDVLQSDISGDTV